MTNDTKIETAICVLVYPEESADQASVIFIDLTKLSALASANGTKWQRAISKALSDKENASSTVDSFLSAKEERAITAKIPCFVLDQVTIYVGS